MQEPLGQAMRRAMVEGVAGGLFTQFDRDAPATAMARGGILACFFHRASEAKHDGLSRFGGTVKFAAEACEVGRAFGPSLVSALG